MLLTACKPTITKQSRLLFRHPEFNRCVGEISRWHSGFEAWGIRNGCRVPSYSWTLELLADANEDLPGPVSAFLGEIPAEVRLAAKPYRFGQVLMLHSMATSSAARDLGVGNPNLLWLLVAAVYQGYVDRDEIARLCSRKQVDVLRRLVRGADKRALRLLRKLKPTDGGVDEARMLLCALASADVLGATCHLPDADGRLLEALTRHPVLADRSLARLLHEETAAFATGPAGGIGELARTVRDIARVAKMLRIERPRQALARCKSLADVRRLHDRWVARMNRPARTPAGDDHAREEGRTVVCQRHAAARVDSTPTNWPPSTARAFPSPPLADTEDIRAITTFEGLSDEGRAQRNCVASYADSVVAGDVYIYKVLRPERATLELRNVRGTWVLGQLKSAANREPRARVKQAVAHWLATAGRSAGGRGAGVRQARWLRHE